jgi:hypothetical protein
VEFGTIMGYQNPPDHVLIDLIPEGFDQLLRNPGTAKAQIALIEVNEGSDLFRCRSLGTGLGPPVWGVPPLITYPRPEADLPALCSPGLRQPPLKAGWRAWRAAS